MCFKVDYIQSLDEKRLLMWIKSLQRYMYLQILQRHARQLESGESLREDSFSFIFSVLLFTLQHSHGLLQKFGLVQGTFTYKITLQSTCRLTCGLQYLKNVNSCTRFLKHYCPRVPHRNTYNTFKNSLRDAEIFGFDFWKRGWCTVHSDSERYFYRHLTEKNSMTDISVVTVADTYICNFI